MALIQLLTVFIAEMLDPYEKQLLSEHRSPNLLAFPAVFLPAFQPDEEKGCQLIFVKHHPFQILFPAISPTKKAH